MYQYPSEKQNLTQTQEENAKQAFVRGTTPTFQYTLIDADGEALDLSDFSTIQVTLAQKVGYRSNCVTLIGEDLTINNNVITFTLTEKQSLTFNVGSLSMQVYGKNENENSWATLAEDVSVDVRKSLKDGDVVE